uniref:E2F/DP family winged-helix DNA-binding domain-containing protein n=1 Tax=Ditylenchus dipsaci TaxID=166011 RepID=A0A915ESK9_9BILA
MFCPIKQDNTAFQNEFVDVCSTDDDDKENRPPNAQARGQNSASNYLTATSSSMLPPINHSHEHFVTKCEESFSQLSSSAVNDKEAESEEDSEKITSRKEKSLGKLCKRFLLAMGEEATNGNDVHLETVAKKMCKCDGSSRSDEQDNKSFYKWHGLAALPQLMDSLQKEAIEARLPERILKVEQAMCSFTELSPMTRRSSDQVGSLVEEGQIGDHLLNHSKAAFNTANSSARSSPMIPIHSYDGTPSTHTHNDDSASDSSLHTSQQLRDRNGKNSLAQLCRRFLMVLLCNPKDKRRVSLDVASTVLIKDPENEGFEPPSRSRCRRLYDIANVLVAMGLIKKVHYLFGTKKIPLFVYCGPEPDASPSQSSMLEFLQRTGLSGVSAADSLNFSACFESPTTSLNSSAISPFSTQQMNVLAQIGGSTSNSANYFGSQPMCSTIGENWQAIQEIERMRPPAASPKTNRKRPLSDHSQTQFSSSPPFDPKKIAE